MPPSWCVRTTLLFVVACTSTSEHAPRRDAIVAPAAYVTTIVTPHVLRGLPMGEPDSLGRVPVTPCTTCHGEHDSSAFPAQVSLLRGPHVGLAVEHGGLRCASCHEATQRDRLHLADGRSIALIDAMALCSQCHGPQKRDYDHGAHGGMRGHWDLSRGPRERNHCVACHDPHAPQLGSFIPMPAPRDRFAAKEADHHD